jgi:hypothetical protein
MPYWDQNVGPYTQQPDGTWEGRGEVKHLSLSRSEVMWEPGVDFDDSSWHAIERAMTPEAIKQLPGFIGLPLPADARTSDIPDGKRSDTMTRLTEYLERPSAKYPEGRRCFIAANRIIVDYRKVDEHAEDWYEPYPCLDADDEVVDEPVIHRISYTVNPEGDDLGLMERLIDLSRTVDDCWNKLLEWKNRCLMPQMIAPLGSQFTQANDIPGFVYRYAGTQPPQWQQTPQVPRELIDMLELAIEHMRALAADVDVQPDPNLAGEDRERRDRTSPARWQSFMGDVAEFHSRLMRHDLSIVARNYTDERQIEIGASTGGRPPKRSRARPCAPRSTSVSSPARLRRSRGRRSSRRSSSSKRTGRGDQRRSGVGDDPRRLRRGAAAVLPERRREGVADREAVAEGRGGDGELRHPLRRDGPRPDDRADGRRRPELDAGGLGRHPDLAAGVRRLHENRALRGLWARPPRRTSGSCGRGLSRRSRCAPRSKPRSSRCRPNPSGWGTPRSPATPRRRCLIVPGSTPTRTSRPSPPPETLGRLARPLSCPPGRLGHRPLTGAT